MFPQSPQPDLVLHRYRSQMLWFCISKVKTYPWAIEYCLLFVIHRCLLFPDSKSMQCIEFSKDFTNYSHFLSARNCQVVTKDRFHCTSWSCFCQTIGLVYSQSKARYSFLLLIQQKQLCVSEFLAQGNYACVAANLFWGGGGQCAQA